jgi:hypothetical protein
MGTRADQLRSEIEKTREDLARDVSELKTEASATARKVAIGTAVALAVYVGFKIVRAILRRSGD